MTFDRLLKMNNNEYPSEKGARTIAIPSTNPEMLPRNRVRRWVAGFTVVAFFYFLWSLGNPSPTSPFYGRTEPCDHTLEDTAVVGEEKVAEKPLVPLEAHIMSKCPDAQVRRTRFLFIKRLCMPFKSQASLGLNLQTLSFKPSAKPVPKPMLTCYSSGLPQTPRPPNNATSPSKSKLHTLLHRHPHRQRRRIMYAWSPGMSRKHHRTLRRLTLPISKDLSRLHDVSNKRLQRYSREEFSSRLCLGTRNRYG